MIVPHTFARRLTFMPHLHILVSAGGFDKAKTIWIAKLNFNNPLLMQRWRLAVITYLRTAYTAGLLRTNKTASQLEILLDMQEERWWSTDIRISNRKMGFSNTLEDTYDGRL